MVRTCMTVVLGAGLLTIACGTARHAEQPGDPAPRVAAQRDAMNLLTRLDGRWRGQAWIMMPSGEKHELTQTERVGPFLDGAVRVIEGRGYEPDGSVSFNALGIISYDPDTRAYAMRSYAQGRAGDFAITLTDDGYTWKIPAGPATMRYEMTLKDGTWHEVGDRVVPGRDPVRFFEMTLERLGDTDWPAAGAVPKG
ncbi:MAG: hypothetical protein R3B49_00060 [Phycisphaerales bacterium]